MNQTTIKESCILQGGVGLHSGKETKLYFFPAEADHGIVFYRSDKGVKIPATYKYAQPSPLCTKIENEGVTVETIEHLMSVCNALGIDNLLIELHSQEIPIMDGSGSDFYNILHKAGIKQLNRSKKVIKIKEQITFQKGDIFIYATPASDPIFTFSIDFDHQQIGAQEYTFQLSELNYVNEIVNAKTFCLEKDIDKMRSMGLIKGGTRENALVLNEDGYFDNMDVMTWLNEPNLHKILDQIGDFYLADNMRINGHIFSSKSGHATHLEFLQYMYNECQDKFEIVEA